MITFINQTGIPFKTVLGDVKNQKDNRRVSVMHGKMRIDTFIASQSIENFTEKVNGLVNGEATFDAITRLYFSNKEYQPIIVQSKTNNAHFLVLAHKLNDKERIVRVEYDGVFAVNRGFQKGKYIATTVSFRTDKPSSIRFITVENDIVRMTTYTAIKDGKIATEIKKVATKSYKGYDVKTRGTIIPYRPHKATHLVLTNSDSADQVIKGNYTIEKFDTFIQLDKLIAHHTEIGFTAASLYVDIDRTEALSTKELEALKRIQKKFRIVYTVFNDGFAKDSTVKAKNLPKRPSQNKGKITPRPNSKVRTNPSANKKPAVKKGSNK